jgi:hypothetical protein
VEWRAPASPRLALSVAAERTEVIRVVAAHVVRRRTSGEHVCELEASESLLASAVN